MDIKSALDELAKEIKDEIIRRLHSSVGINKRTGTNTLIGSNLEKSIQVTESDDSSIVFQIADYYEYIVSGFKRTGNFPGTAHLFIRNITDWVKRKGVKLGNMSQNQIVWYLYKRMIIDGRQIAPRPFIESGYNNNEDPSKILPFLDEFFDKWADKVFELIIKDTDKYFNAA